MNDHEIWFLVPSGDTSFIVPADELMDMPSMFMDLNFGLIVEAMNRCGLWPLSFPCRAIINMPHNRSGRWPPMYWMNPCNPHIPRHEDLRKLCRPHRLFSEIIQDFHLDAIISRPKQG
jgi:hypothetical protein